MSPQFGLDAGRLHEGSSVGTTGGGGGTVKE